MIPDIKDCTLSEKKQYYFNGSHCPYCRNATEYVDSIEVYRESYGFIFLCRPCQAWVNTHNGSPDHSFGFVAKQELRRKRHEVHLLFDPLWQKKVQLGGKKKASQAAARYWLSQRMNLSVEETHVGMFDLNQCKQAIAICKELHLTPEQIKERDAAIKYRIDTVYLLSSELDFGVTEFKIMDKVQLELKHRNGKILYYNPVRRTGRFSNRKKASLIDDIETFIEEHFQPI